MTPKDPARTSRPYRKAAAYRLGRALKAKGLAALDQRTALARDARDWRAAYASDLGGDADLPAAKLPLLEAATVQRTIALYVGGVLAGRPAWIIDKKTRTLSQLSKDYFTAVRALRETLLALGLERQARRVPTLAEYLEARDAEAAAAPAPPEPEPVAVELEAVDVEQDVDPEGAA